MRIQITALILFTIFGLLFVNPALAIDIPDFPACSNPEGTLKVTYSSGTHGIVGDSAEYNGSDSVYQLDNDNLIQCFCSTDGEGIQTNWWKASSLTSAEQQTLLNSGWNLVPNGSLWGLEQTAYYAKNSSFACNGEVDGAGGIGGEVLGLASTGGNFLPFILALIGIPALILGLLLNRKPSGK